jgi:hypothetical protein
LESFLNILEKVVTENNLSGTFGNVSKVNRNGTQVNNPDTVIIGKGPKYTHVLSSGVKSEHITVIARCKDSDRFLLLVLLFKDFPK